MLRVEPILQYKFYDLLFQNGITIILLQQFFPNLRII